MKDDHTINEGRRKALKNIAAGTSVLLGSAGRPGTDFLRQPAVRAVDGGKKERQLLPEVDGMVNALSGLTGKGFDPLSGVLRSIERAAHQEW